MYVNRAPMLFGADKELADTLEKISIIDEDWLDYFLVAGGMNATWTARGKIPEFFVEKEGISFASPPPVFFFFFYMKILVGGVPGGVVTKPTLFLVFTRCGGDSFFRESSLGSV